MPNNELKFNLKSPEGKDSFLSPTVTILDKTLHGNLALQFGYVAKAMIEKVYTDKTKLMAGMYTCEALESAIAKDASAMVTVYMPTDFASRESTDLSKWTIVTTILASDLLKVAQVLNKGYQAMLSIDSDITALPTFDYAVSQPVYYTSPEGEKVAKVGKGKSPIKLTF